MADQVGMLTPEDVSRLRNRFHTMKILSEDQCQRDLATHARNMQWLQHRCPHPANHRLHCDGGGVSPAYDYCLLCGGRSDDGGLTDADTIPPPTPDDLGRDLAADYRRAVTKADYMLPATIRRAAAESIIAATEKVIADRGICERDCTAPLPDRVDSLIVEDRNAQHWRGMYEAENARLAVAEAERDAAVQRAERAEAELAKLKGPTP